MQPAIWPLPLCWQSAWWRSDAPNGSTHPWTRKVCRFPKITYKLYWRRSDHPVDWQTAAGPSHEFRLQLPCRPLQSQTYQSSQNLKKWTVRECSKLLSYQPIRLNLIALSHRAVTAQSLHLKPMGDYCAYKRLVESSESWAASPSIGSNPYK